MKTWRWLCLSLYLLPHQLIKANGSLALAEYFILRQESQLASLSYSVSSLIDGFILLLGNKLDS